MYGHESAGSFRVDCTACGPNRHGHLQPFPPVTKDQATIGLIPPCEQTGEHLVGAFLAAKHFLQAFKCYTRLDDADKLAATLVVAWYNEAYLTERPLFFGRALLTLLRDYKVSLARDLLPAGSRHVQQDNIELGAKVGGAHSAPLAVYRVAVTLT